jgi:hypothetical protein
MSDGLIRPEEFILVCSYFLAKIEVVSVNRKTVY